MTRCPTRACASLTPGPTAATTPQGSWPAITGWRDCVGAGPSGPSPRPRMPIAVLPPPAARYECRSLPHMPEALISNTTSPGPGVGSGNSRSSNRRLPRNTTPRIYSPYDDHYAQRGLWLVVPGDHTLPTRRAQETPPHHEETADVPSVSD